MSWETRYAYPGRKPFEVWVTPLPRFSDSLPDVCVYLYPTRLDAEIGARAGGSGFALEIPSTAFPNRPHILFVTNRHVVRADDGSPRAPVVRVNSQSDQCRIFELEVDDWIPDNDDDLAVHLFTGGDGTERLASIPRKMLALKEHFIGPPNIGIGDDVAFIGRFLPHENEAHGTRFNEPTLRFGNISMIPREPILVGGGQSQRSILIEARSLSGLSGSPVFFYTSRHIMARSLVDPEFDMKLIGVDWGHLTHWTKGKMADHTTDHPADIHVELGPGMMAVVPSWRLNNLLEDPRVRTVLDAEEQKWSRWARHAAVRDVQ